MPMVRLRVPRGTRLARRVRQVANRQMVRRRGQVIKKLSQGVHYFKRTLYASGAIAGSSITDVFGATGFQLSSLPNYTEFTALFDMYKITGVKVTYMPRANSAEAGTNQGLVKFFSVIDYDDTTAPTAINDLLQYESLKVSNSSRDHTRFLKPKIARAIYQSGVSTAYGASTGWIDCDNASVPHYGLKYALQQLPSGNQSFDVKITYYLAFKNVR